MRHHGILNSAGRWAVGVKHELGQDEKVELLCKLAEGQWNGTND